MNKSVKKEAYWIDILYLVMLFEIVSVSFWEEPYLVWTVVIIFIFVFNYILQNRDKRVKGSNLRILRFLLISTTAIVITGLWYIYSYIHEIFYSLNSISPSGTGGSLSSYYILINSLTSPGVAPYMKILYLIAIYPTYTPAPGSLFVWQDMYRLMFSPLYIVFFSCSIIFLITVFFALSIRGISKNVIMNRNLLYFSIFALIFFGLQGVNPLVILFVRFLISIKFSYVAFLYGTNLQFLGFPLIFLYAIAISKTLFALEDFSNRTIAKKNDIKDNTRVRDKMCRVISGKKHHKALTYIILIILVVVYPWYMWTPYATPVYNTGYGNQIIHSVVDIPHYVYEMTNYINSNANNTTTLILPFSNNFLTMGFNSSSFADDQYPALMLGSPTLFQQKVAYNNVTTDIENIIYNSVMLGNNLSTYLSEMNVKFIVLNINFVVGAGNYFYENITYLKSMLNTQPNIQLVREFGPLLVYENMRDNGMFQIGNAVHFNPTISRPYDSLSITKNLSVDGFTHSPFPYVNYSITSNGSIILRNNKLVSTVNPVFFVNNNPLNINISNYHFLAITFKTSRSNVSLYVCTSTIFNNNSFGTTLLQPLNLSTYTLSPEVYVNSTYYSTFVYPLYEQQYMRYSHINNTNNYKLNSIGFGLSFNNLFTNESGSIEITNVSVSKYINKSQSVDFLANDVNNKNQVLVPSNIYTNNPSLNETSIRFKEINPTKYIVEVFNASEPYVLDFKQNFNPAWNIYINNKESNVSHFIADIFNNGWLITQKGNYTMEIIYDQQHEYNSVVKISFDSLIIISVLIISDLFYDFYKKHARNFLMRKKDKR